MTLPASTAIEATGRIFSAGVEGWSEAHYLEVARALVEAHEEETDWEMEPGETGRVALKVYTGSGPGLETPKDLVRALIVLLEERGFRREAIVVFNNDPFLLRRAGYLPPLSQRRDDFEGVPVRFLTGPESTDEDWFYESSLPGRQDFPGLGTLDFRSATDGDRRSHLPMLLIDEVDFWINLPVVVDHPVLGLSGALLNASLWNVTNRERFFRSRISGSTAAAEIAAIPELRERLAFTLVSLERFQFIGGPRFNAYYTASRDRVLLGQDLAGLDRVALQEINRERETMGFEPIEDDLPQFRFYRSLFPGEPEEVRLGP